MTHEDELFREVIGFSRQGHEADALRAVLELAVVAVGADEGSLLLLEDDGQGREWLVFAVSVSRNGGPNESSLIGQRVPLNEGSSITGAAAMLREVQTGRSIYGDLAYPGDRVPPMVLAAPVVAEDSVLGVITAVTFDPERFFDAAQQRHYALAATALASLVAQQHRLGWLRSLQTGRSLEVSRTEAQRLESELLRAVLDLARARPSRLVDLTRLIRIVHGLVKDVPR